jgi:hypothetical protein
MHLKAVGWGAGARHRKCRKKSLVVKDHYQFIHVQYIISQWGGGGVSCGEEMKYCRLEEKEIRELHPARAVSTWARLGSRLGQTAGSSTESSTVSISVQFYNRRQQIHTSLMFC